MGRHPKRLSLSLNTTSSDEKEIETFHTGAGTGVRVRFGGFTLDADTRQLLRGREELHVSTKAFDLLVLLLERRPAVVDKAALRQHLWPGTYVVDANLTNLVAEIRTVLADRSSPPAFVRTVHGVGYAFSAEANEIEADRATDPPGSPRFWVVWQQRATVLGQEETIVGRDPTCAVWVDAAGVSRRHARIRIPRDGASGPAMLEDLDSTNGTFLRGTRLVGPQPLENGDLIRIGRATLTFRAWKDAGAVTKRVRAPKK